MTNIRKWAWAPTEPWEKRPGEKIEINGVPFRATKDHVTYEIDWKTFTVRGLIPSPNLYILFYSRLVSWSFSNGYAGQEGRWLAMLGHERRILVVDPIDPRWGTERKYFLLVWPIQRASSMPEKFIAFEMPAEYVRLQNWNYIDYKLHTLRKPIDLTHMDQNAQFVRGWNAFSGKAVQLRGATIYEWGDEVVDILDLTKYRHYKGYVRCNHTFKETSGAMFQHHYTCTKCGFRRTVWSD